MATRIVTEFTCRHPRLRRTQTIRFAIDGTNNEIDLSDHNANRFRNNVAEFVRHARKVSGPRGRKPAA
jgi:hypothetical protein